MANRFERLFQLPGKQYTEGSPVILAAGVLSKDTQTGSIIAQLKFQSVSEKRINAVKVSLSAYDVSKAEVQGVTDYQYLELNVGNGQEFGSNKAIVMPVSVTRAFAVNSMLIVFDDGSMWEGSGNFTVLPTAKSLSLGEAELEKQYRIATNDKAAYTPNENQGLWQCACGAWNKGTNCTNCRIIKDKVFSALNVASLSEQANTRLSAEQATREAEQERQRIEREQREEKDRILSERTETRRKKIKKVSIIVSVTLVIAIALAIVMDAVIIPNNKYNGAIALMNDGKYEDAISVFEVLDGYKDSATKVMECKYGQAIALMNASEYEKAVLVFEELGDFKDSATQMSVCKTAIKEVAYNYAISLMDTGKHEDAVIAFKELGDYKDSSALIVESSKIVASKYENDGNTERAVYWYRSVGDVEKVKELMYNYVASHKSRTDMLTYEYLVELNSSNYRDSSEIYTNLYAITIEASIKDYKLHYTVHGGPPTGEVTIRVVNKGSWMNGDGTWSNTEDYIFTSAVANEGKEQIRDVTLIYCYRHIITFYDGVTGEQLAQVKYESKS